jgi:predicted methyltransferase
VKAAIEIHRVLKPGGIIGVREEETADFIAHHSLQNSMSQ